MIHLYKMINGKLVFVDYGVLQHKHTYELQGFYVRVVNPKKRKAVKKKVNITITHRIRKPVKISILSYIKDFITDLVCTPELCYA